MSGGHKYVKRSGTQGNYRYWYKLPDGRIAEGNDAQQKQGKIEHVKRLIAGKGAHHEMNHDTISRVTGHDPAKVRSIASNMATAKRAGRDHDFHENHLKEAHHVNTETSEYASAHSEASGGETSSAATAPATPAAPAERAPSRSRRSSGSNQANTPTPAAPAAASADAEHGSSQGDADPREARKKELLKKLKKEHGVDLSGTPSEVETARAISQKATRRKPAATETMAPGEEAAAARVRELEAEGMTTSDAQGVQGAEERSRATPQVPGNGARDMGPGTAGAATPNPDTSSTSPHGQELVRFDPDFAASEEATNQMIEQQQQGANPYLVKAVDIFGRIMGDIKEPRKTKVRHMLDAIVRAKNEAGDGPLNKELVLAHFKAMPGNERVRTLPAEDFERATFHTLDEVLENKPVDPELERMKRGFAMKQFNRCKPFLKPEFVSRLGADGGPPPYPTFGDLKPWSAHEGGKPAWAGTSRTAMPQEMHEAAHKVGGKPQHPPSWMPLHLTPVWNYVSARAGSEGSNPYQAPAPSGSQVNSQSGKVSVGNQATYQEGIVISSLRKYVQQRGGLSQLVDIPKAKLAAIGTSHADIFKADDSDAALMNALKTKIIDPVGLMKHVMKELGIKPKAAKAKVKKSFELVIDLEDEYNPGETLFKSAPILRKSEPDLSFVISSTPSDNMNSIRIRRIQEELRARGL